MRTSLLAISGKRPEKPAQPPSQPEGREQRAFSPTCTCQVVTRPMGTWVSPKETKFCSSQSAGKQNAPRGSERSLAPPADTEDSSQDTESALFSSCRAPPPGLSPNHCNSVLRLFKTIIYQVQREWNSVSRVLMGFSRDNQKQTTKINIQNSIASLYISNEQQEFKITQYHL